MLRQRAYLRVALYFVAGLLVGSVATTALAANDPEQRCSDLGAQCICGETLNANDGTATNPDNPTNSTTKQCNGGDALSITDPPGADYVAVGTLPVALPSTASGVTHVLRIDSGTGTSSKLDGD